MADPGFVRRLRARLLLPVVLAAGACGAPPPPPAPVAPPPPPPEVVGAAELDALGDLLRLADTRDFERDVVLRAAESRSPTVRRQAALALGRLRRSEGFLTLAQLLADPDTSVAATAAFALGQVGDSAAVGLLANVLGDTTTEARPTVGVEAAHALGKLGSLGAYRALGGYIAEAPARPETAAPIVTAALLSIWKFEEGRDEAIVSPWLGVQDVEVRRAAAYALTRRPTPGASPRLLAVLTDPDPLVRAYAARGLTSPLTGTAGLAADQVVQALLGAVDDPAYPVRIEAVRALGTFREPRAIARLRLLLSDSSRHVVVTAAEALGGLGPAAEEAALDLERVALPANQPDAVRVAALEALVRVSPARALPAVDRLAASPAWRLREGAARSYARLRAQGAEGIRALLDDPDPRVAAAALRSMVEAGPGPLAPSRELLVSSLGHPDVMVRAAALTGLWDLADPATLPLLLDAFDRAQADTIPDAALAALDVLTAIRARGGGSPERALLARFPRPANHHVVRRAIERFGAAASDAWGPELPLEPRPAAEYRALAGSWLVPGAGDRRPQVVVATGQGTLELELFADHAPLTVESFLALARSGYFDGQEWARVVANFVVQGGDPRGDTSGGPGYTIRDEINRQRFLTGTLGMALSGPDTGGSQFFVTHSPTPHLDGTYTVFGRVVSGQDVAERLLPGDAILSIREVP